MEHIIADENRTYDVLTFGSCHSYTSFNAKYFEDTYGLSSYVLGNPGEIMPVTYLRMVEQFKKDIPQVALVETWGINAHETYFSKEDIFEKYMPVSIETLPFSLKKAEVIHDFYSLDMILENFATAKYKDLIMKMELREFDFNYSFEKIVDELSDYNRKEISMRIENNGFCEMPIENELYTPYMDVSDYHERQPDIAEDDTLELESDIFKYVKKIINLCKKNNVKLIFYKAPYISTENELRKNNWFSNYCKDNELPFYNLEKEIIFDISTDFLDYEHLNINGAQKATDYLAKNILETISVE